MTSGLLSLKSFAANAAGVRAPHVCNCVGCCPKCGCCVMSPHHTAEYCQLLQAQKRAREDFLR